MKNETVSINDKFYFSNIAAVFIFLEIL